MNSSTLRERYISRAGRIVVKIGTNLIGGSAESLNESRIGAFSGQIARLVGEGRQVAVVSSGAIGAGMRQMGMERRPRELPALQAAASVGQSKLVACYDQALRQHGLHAGQILLTRDDFDSRRRYLNAANTVHALFENRCVPVINENDTISTDEIQFGDNDLLAAFVTHLIQADLLVLLTCAPGLCARPPLPECLVMCAGDEPEGRFGRRVSVVKAMGEEIDALAVDETTPDGTGGMLTKLQAARIAVEAGEAAVIADGRKPDAITELMAAGDVGTLFVPSGRKLGSRKRWIRFTRRTRGVIRVDKGAEETIRNSGRSLLPSGITAVKGDFERGDTVSVRSDDGEEIARGLTNYCSGDIRRIMGCRSDELAGLLGQDYFDEVVHRDNMALV